MGEYDGIGLEGFAVIARRLVVACLVVFACSSTGPAAETARPSPEETAQLGRAARTWGRGVALVGDPNRGQGTAFLISREYRLLATAAHVADLYRGPGTIWAVFNGTWEARPVARVWYHPSLCRTLDTGLTVRSPDPIDGAVCVPGPDVAVIQLAEGGSPLPPAWELAPPQALLQLTGKPVASLGYPGYGDWPSQARVQPASMRTGVVQLVDTFDFAGGGHPERRQLIEHSAPTPEGSSGSPVFTADGKVVAVHNILKLTGAEALHETGMSVRIDALWELLAYHKLDRAVAIPREDWMVVIPTESPIDPRRDEYRRAANLVRESAIFAARRDFETAGARCNEAIRIAPEYAAAYLQRSRVFTGYATTFWATLKPEVKRRQADWAIADAMTGFRLAPEKTDGLGLLLQNSLYLGLMNADNDVFREVIGGIEALLQRPHLEAHEKSFLTNLRAQARHFLGDFEGALKDYNEAIRLSPREAIWYANRAQFWDQRGRPDLAAADRQAAASP